MDPSTLSNLDPKLKETYEKVMGTSTVQAGQDQTPPPTADGMQAEAQPAPNTSPANPNPGDGLSAPVQGPLTEDPPQMEQPQTVTINQPLPNPMSSNIIAPKSSGHGGLLKVFYVLGGTVFFVIYIFFWMKIFNLSLPF